MTKNPRDVAQPDATKIREDIQETRQKLGDTVEALAHKADVPARAKEKAHEVLDTTKAKATVAMDKAEHVVDKLPEPAAKRAGALIAAIRQRPGVFLTGTVVTFMVLRRVVRRK
jgi:hypothetical protein